MYETTVWPFIPARDFKVVPPGRHVRLFVVHDGEIVKTAHSAEDMARYFQHPDYPSSAHINVDCDSIVQSVKDNNVAFGAKGGNHDAIHMELTGYGRQSRKDWWDGFSIPMLALGADAAAQYCLKYMLPPRRLSVAEVKDGVTKGICGHVDITQAFHQSDHTDPGPNFPWPQFMAFVQTAYSIRKELADA